MYPPVKPVLVFLFLLWSSLVTGHSVNQHPCPANEIKKIKSTVQQYIEKHAAVSTPVAVLSPQCISTYASAKLRPAQQATDDALVYLHKVNGRWYVLTIGTHFDKGFLKQVPKELRVSQ